MNCFELIRKRRSVRTFKGSINNEDLEKIKEFTKTIKNPYDIDIHWHFLNAKDLNLSVPVIVGSDVYVAGTVEKKKHSEEAFGYSFEQLVLYAISLGIGTTWIAGTMDRKGFEKAVDLKDNEIMPCISPLGYPADKMAFRELMMRKGIRADFRKEDKEVFFEDDFDHVLKNNDRLKEAFEAVRWAPSAVNKQPWRLLKKDNRIHFYKDKTSYVVHEGMDIQRVDLGIALYHFVKVCNEAGINTGFEINDPQIECGDKEYIATVITD